MTETKKYKCFPMSTNILIKMTCNMFGEVIQNINYHLIVKKNAVRDDFGQL